MRFTLKPGRHYAWPPATFPWAGQQKMERYVTFSPECAYDSAPYNAYDVNKLFGLSFGVGGVHHNSARFGWRWSNSDQCIELLAYVYKEGQRNQDEQLRFPVVAQVKPGQRLRLRVDYEPVLGRCIFQADDALAYALGERNDLRRMHVAQLETGLPGYGLTHGLYFGGVLSSPHVMTVKIDRV